MKFIVRGNTYSIRNFLKACGCVWHDYCKVWTTENKDLKKVLRGMKVADSAIKKIHLEKINEKSS